MTFKKLLALMLALLLVVILALGASADNPQIAAARFKERIALATGEWLASAGILVLAGVGVASSLLTFLPIPVDALLEVNDIVVQASAIQYHCIPNGWGSPSCTAAVIATGIDVLEILAPNQFLDFLLAGAGLGITIGYFQRDTEAFRAEVQDAHSDFIMELEQWSRDRDPLEPPYTCYPDPVTEACTLPWQPPPPLQICLPNGTCTVVPASYSIEATTPAGEVHHTGYLSVVGGITFESSQSLSVESHDIDETEVTIRFHEDPDYCREDRPIVNGIDAEVGAAFGSSPTLDVNVGDTDPEAVLTCLPA